MLNLRQKFTLFWIFPRISTVVVFTYEPYGLPFTSGQNSEMFLQPWGVSSTVKPSPPLHRTFQCFMPSDYTRNVWHYEKWGQRDKTVQKQVLYTEL